MTDRTLYVLWRCGACRLAGAWFAVADVTIEQVRASINAQHAERSIHCHEVRRSALPLSIEMGPAWAIREQFEGELACGLSR